MKIIDAHHHFWDPEANPHPWLTGDPIPFRYGDYSAIRQPFMPEDYDTVSTGWDVVASVTMEGEWDPADPTGEAQWMQSLAERTGRPAAHAAQGWLDRKDFPAVLEAYRALPIVRSIRHKPRANSAPGGAVGSMADATFRDGFRLLAKEKLAFELQTPWWHLDEAVEMAATAPDTLIVLNHAGLPSDRSPEGLSGWRAAIARFAAATQSVVKISGIGLADRPWKYEDNRDIIRFCIDTFGPARAMFASNFPVDSLCGSFDTIWNGFDRATTDNSPKERDQLFFRTAARVYSLDIEA